MTPSTLDQDLLAILACPCDAHGRLEYDASAAELTCTICDRVYRVEDGIPVLLLDEARRLVAPHRLDQGPLVSNAPVGDGRLPSPVVDPDRLEHPETLTLGDAGLMLRSVAGAGAQVRESATLAIEAGLHDLADEGRPRAVVVAGVGTAARTGDILSVVAGPRCPVPVLSHRSSGVPGWVGAADVVLAVSASGHGPEALAAAEAAAARGARLVAIGAPDSPLQSYAERARAMFVPVPPRRPARISIWALTVPVLLAARAVGLVTVTEADLAETAARLDADAERCRPHAEAFVNPGKSLALELAGSIPVVWGSSRLATVAASRFADGLAANARYPAISGSLVEAGRGRIGLLDGVFGSMIGPRDIFADPEEEESPTTRLRLVLLRDDPADFEPRISSQGEIGQEGVDSPVDARRAEAVISLAAERGIGVSVLHAEGASPLERLASMVTVPDFASVYLALAHGLDPIAVPAVTEMKEDPVSASGGSKAIIAALLANLGIAVTKFIAFALTMSSSMLAEAIHSVADSGNQLLLLIGGRRATRAATPMHPFGYGRERYIYAFIVSIVLFSVGGLFALYEGFHKISHPAPITSWQWVPVTVLVVAIGLETFSFRTAIVEANAVRGKTSWSHFVRRAKAPELPVVLLEDFAALIGLVFALFGVGLTLLTSDGTWDGVGTVAIGALLVAVAVFLAIETKSLLLGEAADERSILAIERALTEVPAVESVIHMRTLHLGPDELLVAAKIAVRHDSTAAAIAAGIDAAEAGIRAAVPIARVIYLEPDIRRPEASTTDAVDSGSGSGSGSQV